MTIDDQIRNLKTHMVVIYANVVYFYHEMMSIYCDEYHSEEGRRLELPRIEFDAFIQSGAPTVMNARHCTFYRKQTEDGKQQGPFFRYRPSQIRLHLDSNNLEWQEIPSYPEQDFF